jgi:hypothetical protein
MSDTTAAGGGKKERKKGKERVLFHGGRIVENMWGEPSVYGKAQSR